MTKQPKNNSGEPKLTKEEEKDFERLKIIWSGGIKSDGDIASLKQLNSEFRRWINDSLKLSIARLAYNREQKARQEVLEKVEKIIRDTLSADTPKYHKEVGELYKKLQELKKEL